MARAAGAAADDLAAGDPDVHARRTTHLCRQVRHRVTDGEGGADGALGVVVVRDRGAEHGHDAVAEVLVDVAVVLLDDPVDPVEEAFEQGVQRFGVEFPAQRGVADQIGEQHGHLPALATQNGSRRRGDRPGVSIPLLGRRTKRRNSLEELPAMAEEHAELLEVGLAQFKQDLGVDRVVTEDLLVLA